MWLRAKARTYAGSRKHLNKVLFAFKRRWQKPLTRGEAILIALITALVVWAIWPGNSIAKPVPIETPKPHLKPVLRVKVPPKLKEVSYTAPVAQAPTQAPVIPQATSGNGYVWGNCTWFVKNMRPDVPRNFLED